MTFSQALDLLQVSIASSTSNVVLSLLFLVTSTYVLSMYQRVGKSETYFRNHGIKSRNVCPRILTSFERCSIYTRPLGGAVTLPQNTTTPKTEKKTWRKDGNARVVFWDLFTLGTSLKNYRIQLKTNKKILVWILNSSLHGQPLNYFGKHCLQWHCMG